MAFQFHLEKVLAHRRRLEDEAKRDFMLAQANTLKALRDLEALYLAIDIARLRGHELQIGISDSKMAPTLQNIDVFIGGQKIRIERQRAPEAVDEIGVAGGAHVGEDGRHAGMAFGILRWTLRGHASV